jgi:hypothetical protein
MICSEASAARRHTSGSSRGRRRWPGFAVLLAGLAAVWLTAGCGSRPLLVPVKGVVTLDGKPLSSGVVQFQPASGQVATGAIAGDGTFTLSRLTPNDGVPPGSYRVAVTAFDPQAEVQSAETLIVPVRYTRFGSSGIEFTVFPGTREPFVISLSSTTAISETPAPSSATGEAAAAAPESSPPPGEDARGTSDSNAGGN